MGSKPPSRLGFIDFARGVVMAVMAWDHVSGFWNRYHHGGEGILGMAPPFVDTKWFLLRFVSHICAPTFIFLAGTVLAISTARRLARGETQREVSLHIAKRGLVLLLLEAGLVAPAFSLPWTYFGVLACIGVCLIVLSVARRLPTWVLLVLGLVAVLGHPFLSLEAIPPWPNWGWYLRVVLHEPNFERWPYVGLYPVIPWLGVMALGWCFGSYLESQPRERLQALDGPLALTGAASLALFWAVRYLNGYGNLLPRQGNTLVDWLYVSKYPPSLAFLLWTLGIMCLLMALGLALEKHGAQENPLIQTIHTYGRNPLFFYVAHLWLYRARWPDFTPNPRRTLFLELPETVLFWLIGLVVLRYLCQKYEPLKRRYPKPILQYL